MKAVTKNKFKPMDFYKQETVFFTSIDMFRADVIVCLNYTNLEDVLKKLIKNKVIDKAESDHFIESMKEEQFNAITFWIEERVFIFMPYKSTIDLSNFMGIMTHEFHHATYMILDSRDTQLEEATMETYAYMQQFLMEELIYYMMNPSK